MLPLPDEWRATAQTATQPTALGASHRGVQGEVAGKPSPPNVAAAIADQSGTGCGGGQRKGGGTSGYRRRGRAPLSVESPSGGRCGVSRCQRGYKGRPGSGGGFAGRLDERGKFLTAKRLGAHCTVQYGSSGKALQGRRVRPAPGDCHRGVPWSGAVEMVTLEGSLEGPSKRVCLIQLRAPFSMIKYTWMSDT